jgi:hypothetical protein
MDYTAQYQEFDEEGKAHKINKRGSDYDARTRFIARRGHREAYEQVAVEEAQEPQPEPEPEPKTSSKKRVISVTQYKPSEIKHVIRKSDDVKTVSQVLTRSGELRKHEQAGYERQQAIEHEKENKKAERKGARRAMPTFDRAVDWTAEHTEKPAQVKEKLQEARDKILHTQIKEPQQVTTKVPTSRVPATRRQPIIPKEAMKKSFDNVRGKGRAPFGVENKKLPYEKKTLPTEHKKLPTQKTAGNPLQRPRGAPFGERRGAGFGERKGNPFGEHRGKIFVERRGNPLGSHKGSPFGERKGNPLGHGNPGSFWKNGGRRNPFGSPKKPGKFW